MKRKKNKSKKMMLTKSKGHFNEISLIMLYSKRGTNTIEELIMNDLYKKQMFRE